MSRTLANRHNDFIFETNGAVNKKFVEFCGRIAKNAGGSFHHSIPSDLSFTVKSATAFLVKWTSVLFSICFFILNWLLGGEVHSLLC